MKTTHDQERFRFTASNAEGEFMGEIMYEPVPQENALAATHTRTREQFRGRGVGSALLDALTDYARKNRLKIIPVCSFVAAMFEKDPKRYHNVMT